ncbi:predicted protein [Naegleria gruberi]|uniref:Predicted protein n=1 Tax=Naegleria gruberi TaxID=5762 RepID=D2VQI4_NAEGR|nr:uncharacterized protein NAEGRDRAFT_71236 [Naegleria gruberi]EFC40875.1 predicted protein [Naegleria gruberi]|eukprot:XP_002673619.1 predicted protein [Naegleria gruberi strain NEG-M]
MCYSASEKFVPSLDFPELHTCFKLYFRKIALSAIAEASSHYRLAKKYWSSSNTYRPKKYIVHTFRDLLFAIQIVKFRRIVDFSQSNDLYYEIMGKEETDWNYFDSIYYARYQKMKEELNELVMLPPIVKEIEKLPNSIHVYVTRMNNDFQSISDELESYFSLDITHKNENNVEYLYFRGTDETPLYSDFTLKLFNGCILGKFNNVTELICLPHKKAIPVGNRYQPKVLDIKNGCTIWNIEASANIENLMVHIYYDIFTHNWKMLHNEKPSCEIIWKKFKELGYETPNNVDFTYTFEVILERKTFIIQQINLFSIQDTKKEVMVDFSEELYSTKRLKHNGLTSLTHITNYAKQINPLETKEILIIEKSCILSYILPQFNILSNSSENAAERVTIELLRTSLNNPQLIEMARDYVTLRFNSSTIFDSVHKKISLLVDKISFVINNACAAPYPCATVYRPFSADSLWNSRPVNPVLAENVTIPESEVKYYPAIGEGSFSTGVYIASASDPSVTVYGPSDSVGINLSEAFAKVPSLVIPRWPGNTIPASGGDGHCEIYDPIDNRIHSFWQLKKVNGTWRATLYGWSALDGPGWSTPATFYSGARAVGIASSAGLIRTHEVNDGDTMYRHALTMSMTNNGLDNNPTYVFPATAADSDAATTNYGNIPEGSRLFLPSSFNVSKLISTPKLKKIAETLKTYGAYVTDRNYGTPYFIYVEMGSNYTLHPGGWNNVAASELQVIRAALRPMVSCSGWLNGNDQQVTFTQNQNVLSMRGPWGLESGPSGGSYDTWKQAVVFANRTSRTTFRTYSANGFAKVSWGSPTSGVLYNVTAKTTGGGQFRLLLNMQCQNKSNIDTGALSNGQSYLFTWPSSYCSSSIFAYSGVNQESSVSVTMLRYEAPQPQDTSSKGGSTNPSSSSTIVPTPSKSSRNVNSSVRVEYSLVLGIFFVILSLLQF